MKGCTRALCLLVLALQLFACQTPLNMRITASHDLNPNAQGHPQPVVLRAYQLKSATLFNQANYLALANTAHDVLGDSLLAQHETILTPGVTRHWQITRAQDCRYLGLVLLVRAPTESGWRQLLELPPPAATGISDIQVTAMQPLKVEPPSWWQKIQSFGPKA